MLKIFKYIWQLILKILNFIKNLFKRKKKEKLKLVGTFTSPLSVSPETEVINEIELVFLDLLGRGYEIKVYRNEIGYVEREEIEGVIGRLTGRQVEVEMYGTKVLVDETIPVRVRVIKKYVFEPFVDSIVNGLPYVPALVVKEIKWELYKEAV